MASTLEMEKSAAAAQHLREPEADSVNMPSLGQSSFTVPGYSAERNSNFQKFMTGVMRDQSSGELHDEREALDGLGALGAFVARNEHDGTGNRIIENGNKAAQQQSLTMSLAAPVIGAALAAAAPKDNAQINRKLEAALSKPVIAPVLAKNDVANPVNVAPVHQATMAKEQTVTDGMEGLKLYAETLRKQAQSAEAAPAKPSGVGGAAAAIGIEAGLAMVGLPGAGLVLAAAGAVVKTMSINPEGQGTLSSQKTASEPIRRRGEKSVSSYQSSASEAQMAAGPQQPSSAGVWDKLGRGPGFGSAGRDDIGARSKLAGLDLAGISEIKFDRILKRSPALRGYESGMADVRTAKAIEQRTEEMGLAKDGKSTLDENKLAMLKTPASPSVPGFARA